MTPRLLLPLCLSLFALLFHAAPVGAQNAAAILPASGKIAYQVFRGEDGMQLGEAEHTWNHDGKHYRMSLDVRTTGMVAVLYRLQYTQHSQGKIGAQGLIPERFNIDQKGRKPEEALFDWAKGNVSIRKDGRERRSAQITTGDQDVLSTWHQIAFIPPAELPRVLTVATAKNAKKVIIESLGEERLRLQEKLVSTRRLRVSADDGSMEIEMWLAPSAAMLPVRVMLTTEKGERLDLRTSLIEYTTPKGQARPLGTAG